MRIACCIPKATNTHSDHAILNGFPLEKLLQKCASMLRPTYIACLFFFLFFYYGPILEYIFLNGTQADF